jgi:hypothetical protein
MKNIFPVIFLIAVVFACSDDEELFFNEPNVKVQFYNIDSLLKLENSLVIIDDSIAFIAFYDSIWNDSISFLTDTINSLVILIDSGQIDLEPKKIQFEDNLVVLLSNDSIYTELDRLLDSVRAIIIIRRLDVTSGKMLLTSLQNTENNESLIYEDSMYTYSLPLSMTSDITSYNLEIDNKVYKLEFEYKRTNKEDEKSRITITAYDIAIRHHTFDSINVICNTSLCDNDDSSLQIYF